MSGLNEAQAAAYAVWFFLKWVVVAIALLLVGNAVAYILFGEYLLIVTADGYITFLGDTIGCLYGWACSP